jgi:phosphatidylserine/phosphatidylglycerophosphate/cardiolipin synthase-like enzyme
VVFDAIRNAMTEPGRSLAETSTVELVTNQDILPAIIKLIEDASERVILVSPYNKYTNHLRNEVKRAAQKLDVTAVCRKEQEKDEKEHIEQLIEWGADVYLVERLHAKIFANEEQVIVTSMNLHSSSDRDSTEIAVRISDRVLHKEIIDFIEDKVTVGIKPLEAPNRASQARAAKATTKTRKAARPPRSTAQGHCIRCGQGVALNLDRPLCDDCYPKWAEYKKLDYAEKFCISCGQQRKNISYAKPRCLRCWREQEKS